MYEHVQPITCKFNLAQVRTEPTLIHIFLKTVILILQIHIFIINYTHNFTKYIFIIAHVSTTVAYIKGMLQTEKCFTNNS